MEAGRPKRMLGTVGGRVMQTSLNPELEVYIAICPCSKVEADSRRGPGPAGYG